MSGEDEKTCRNCGRRFRFHDDFLKDTSRWRLCEDGHLWFNCRCDSTNMIKKDKFNWYKPSHQLSKESRGIFNHLASIRSIPFLPNSIMKLQLLVEDESSVAEDIVKELKKNPLIAGRILELSQRLSLNKEEKITELSHAVNYIGRSYLSDIIHATGLESFDLKTKTFKAEEFWQESYSLGFLTEELVGRFSSKITKDQGFIAGSLANLGKLVLAIYLPEVADQISELCQNPKKLYNWPTAEKSVGAYSHCTLGEIAGAIWGLPDFAIEASMSHHCTNHEAVEPSIAAIVTLANQINHWIRLEPHRIDHEILKNLSRKFSLSEKDLDVLVSDLFNLKAPVGRAS